MNQIEALRETVQLAERQGMPRLPGSDLGLDHLREMLTTVESVDFSDAKLGRWLGWAQCSVVTAAIGVTLADMKVLNMKWAHDESQGNAMTEGADQQSRLGGGTHSGGNRAPYDSALIAPSGVEEIVRAQQLAALRNALERQLANANLAAHQAAVTLGAIRCDREDPGVPDIANLVDDVQRDLTEASSLVARWRW